jgi:hypothetical protein
MVSIRVNATHIAKAERARGTTYVRIYDKAMNAFTNKLNDSIIEAENRYEKGMADDKPYAAFFWRPEKTDASAMGKAVGEEIAEVSLKIGNKKWEILEDSNGMTTDTLRVKGDEVKGILEEVKSVIDNIDNHEPLKADFHEKAIEIARPPKDKRALKEGRDTEYDYSAEEDRYLKK